MWNKASENRVAQTAQALSQMKSLKMAGLEGAMSNQIQKLRVAEVSRFKFFVVLSTSIAVIGESSISLKLKSSFGMHI